MTLFEAAPVLAGLKDFQRVTVDHVMDRYFGAHPTRRYLVADETGLGKSVVARGVVAKMIEKLQHDDEVDRIDIVYVCSNQDIARQNLDRLDVTGRPGSVSTSRLSMLACEIDGLGGAADVAGKPVNLIAFTPGTSFDKGWRTGKREERALLYVLLADILSMDGWTRRAAKVLLRATAGKRGFDDAIDWVQRKINGPPDRPIRDAFAKEAASTGALSRFADLLTAVGRRAEVGEAVRRDAREVIGDLRHCLARAGVERLQPDLVIFDEFQRFRHLMDPVEGGPSAELARELYDYPAAKLLLLSATPYKPYTMVEDAQSGDDHYRDFRQTLRFLCPDSDWNATLDDALSAYRGELASDVVVEAAAASRRVRELLLLAMCRTERPRLGQDGMLQEYHATADGMTQEDLLSFVALRQLGRVLEAPAPIDYWKSAPYFLNFATNYQIGDKLEARLKSGRSIPGEALANSQLIRAGELAAYEPIDPGNARMRALFDGTVGAGWWRLLWLPPSLPYQELGRDFAEAADAGITKRLVFSSWAATPPAVSGLLSYEAERRIVEGASPPLSNDPVSRRNRSSRLEFRFEGERPVSLSAVSLFWPQPVLAELCDPLTQMREVSPELSSTVVLVQWAQDRLIRERSDPAGSAESVHELALTWPAGMVPGAIDAQPGQDSDDDADSSDDPRGWERAAAWALALARPETPSGPAIRAHLPDLARLALFAPGNLAWRAVGRLVGAESQVTREGRWHAALALSNGLRSLFNRFESVVLLDKAVPGVDYWQAVLTYAADGGLQSVLDEYLHTLASESASVVLDDDGLLHIASRAAEAISLRAASIRAFDPLNPHAPVGIPLRCRFALRYGGRRETAEDARQPEVRAAFNSPFWPFVLSTTSAGQEGIDFHWWCSAVVHWNTPTNPVDFEQREGRVHRFGGHAIRRNVADRHRLDVVASYDPDPWRAAYDAARDSTELGEFSPYWIYPGEAKIERHVLMFPLSKDIERYAQLKVDLATYRLAFGQPRQEDLLELLSRRKGTVPEPLDLRP